MINSNAINNNVSGVCLCDHDIIICVLHVYTPTAGSNNLMASNEHFKHTHKGERLYSSQHIADAINVTYMYTGGGHSHRLCSHNCDRHRSMVNSQSPSKGCGQWSTVKARSEIRSTLTMADHSGKWMDSYAKTTVCTCGLSLEHFCVDSEQATKFRESPSHNRRSKL